MWFDELLYNAPNYGYYPELSKTVLIVGLSGVQEASALFGDLGIRVVSGGRFLGGYMLATSSSQESTSVMINAIRGATEFKVIAHLDQLAKVHHDVSGRREARVQCLLTSVLECIPSPVCCTIRRAIDFQISGWLTVLPLTCHHFDLSPQQFHDTLLLCYRRPLSLMPSQCDGCGSTFDLSHAVGCCKGILVTQHHNEVKNSLGDLAALAYKDVIHEPIVREGSITVPVLIADLGIRGVWLPQIEALFDIQVTDADAPLYLSRFVKNVLATAEEEKKRKYVTAAEALHGSFSPFVVTVDGVLGPEAVLFLQRLAEKLSGRWEKGYGEIRTGVDHGTPFLCCYQGY